MDGILTTESEGLDITMPVIPPRSRLYHLEPVGVGTSQVESLTSYITRLAESHRVSVAALYKYELYPVVRKLRTGNSQIKISGRIRLPFDIAKPMNSFSDHTRDWVKALESSTLRSDLSFLTALPWGTAFTEQGLLRETLTWCPACYEEWQEAGKIIYTPFAWILNAVTVCSTHVCSLEEVCPSCHCRVQILASHSRPGHCSKCRNWLGKKNEIGGIDAENIGAKDLFNRAWASNTVCEWISIAQQLPFVPTRKDMSRIISELINLSTGGKGKAFAHLTGLYPTLVYNWLKNGRAPRLEFILRICSALNLSLAELMTSRNFTNSKSLSGAAFDPLRQRMPPRPPYKRADVREILKAALDEDPPPSLQEIAKRLGYNKSVSTLRITSRDLCNKIAARHRAFMKGKGCSKRFTTDYETVRLALEKALEQDCPPSIQDISSDLNYANPSSLHRRFPELCSRIVAKRAEVREEVISSMRKVVEAALSEEPPPCLREVARRLGESTAFSIYRRFHESSQIIVARYSAWKKTCAEQLELKLEAALKEEPPRTLKEIARELGVKRETIRASHPHLCHLICDRYAAYESELVEEKKRLFGEKVREVAVSLIEQGIHPSVDQVMSRMKNPTRMYFAELTTILREIRREFGLPDRDRVSMALLR